MPCLRLSRPYLSVPQAVAYFTRHPLSYAREYPEIGGYMLFNPHGGVVGDTPVISHTVHDVLARLGFLVPARGVNPKYPSWHVAPDCALPENLELVRVQARLGPQ